MPCGCGLAANSAYTEQINAELIDEVAGLKQKSERAEEQKNKLIEDLDSLDDKLAAEKRANNEHVKQNKKLEGQLKATQIQLQLALKDKHEFDVDCKRRDSEIGELKLKAQGDANLIAKLQAMLRRCISRIEDLEHDLLEERKLRMKAERQYHELRNEFDVLTEQMAEASGQLTAETHINKIRAEEVSMLRRDLQKRNLNHEAYISDLCNMQYATVNNLRNLSQQVYLLEKSRVIKQAPGERSYHIFYQIMTQKSLRDRFGLSDNIRDYQFVSQAEITVPGMNDKEEWEVTDNAFNVMGFSAREKEDLYKLCSAIMHIGNSTFKQKPRDEQAEVDDMKSPTAACKLFGINTDQFLNALTRPRIKVGMEWVNKGQNVQQVEWAVGALSKAIYARMFNWLIKRVNKTLQANVEDMVFYIGVLDIAGFEIFDRNSFEQLWINFVNEKLQQFFNHHMFVLEQEEYQREGIEWTFIDFGLDLQACIELIEKPLGIVSMLDEECIVPKANDMTYVDKLLTQHCGKHPNFQKAKPPKGKQAEAHFSIVHYAGTVRYNAEQWLDKNKDPLNDSAVAILKTSDKEGVLYQLWEDYQTDVDREESEKRGKTAAKKKGKSASFLTVSTMYRESLTSLMTMLHTTHPHFIRCIIPNEKKTSGLIDAPLVLNQLTCNGVLEGIRICRKGFPNRMMFADFRYRYAILAAEEAAEKDPAKATKAMLRKLSKSNQLNVDTFKVGTTKVFFRAGMLARLEELRDDALTAVILKFQCSVRHYLAQLEYKRRLDREDAYPVIQDNVRAWIKLRSWPWYRLFSRLKPMLKGMKSNAEVEALERKCKELEESHKREEEARKKYADELRAKIEQYEETKAASERDRMLLDKRNKEIEELNRNLKLESEANYENAKKAAELEKLREKERKEWEEKERRMQMEAENEANQHKNHAEKLKEQLAHLQADHDKIAAQRKAQVTSTCKKV
uniref:Myosin motor domain-containing protein n=1 Tax=Caenorhabditis japonica TaxID=281687 RepID=A0A8R1I049_CAEJA